jgi:hypothetical protein
VTILPERFRYELSALVRRGLSPWLVKHIPISRLRNIFGASFNMESHHLVQTLHAFEASSDICWSDTPTAIYHEVFTPKSFFDVSEIPGTQCLPIFIYPWGTFTDGSTSTQKHIESSRFLGPSSDGLVKAEIDGLVKLYRSISEEGLNLYCYPHNDINGTLLIDDYRNKTACVIMQGNHRVAAAVALGLETVPVRFGGVCLAEVRRSGLHYWPLVASGQIDPDSAAAVFDFLVGDD